MTQTQKNDIRARAWCFTVNNYTDTDEILFRTIIEKEPVTYVVFGREKGESGTPHLQGFIHFENQRTLGGLKKKVHKTAHWEPAKSNMASATYCKKDGDFEEYGTFPKQGARNDMKTIQGDLDDRNIPIIDVYQEHFEASAKFYKFFERYRFLKQIPRNPNDPPPQVRWYYGSTGTGKTSSIYNEFKPEDIYVKIPSKWFDGYTQQKVIVYDDIAFINSTEWFRQLLQITDRYPYAAEIKGGSVQINSPYIIFTCDRSPQEFFKSLPDYEYQQFYRRLSHVCHFTEDGIEYEKHPNKNSIKELNETAMAEKPQFSTNLV